MPLLRYASTASTDNRENASLADYVARMPAGQERIYYLVGESHADARLSPHLEVLQKKGIEVLLLADRVDEWVMGQVSEYGGKRFKDVARGELELGALADAADSQRLDAALKQSKGLLKRCKDVLGEQVSEVRPSARLQESPACLVRGDPRDAHPSIQRWRVSMRAMGIRVDWSDPMPQKFALVRVETRPSMGHQRGCFRPCDFDHHINRRSPSFCQQRLWEVPVGESIPRASS